MNDANDSTGTPVNDGQLTNDATGQDSVRRIPAARIASLRRKKQGAAKRIKTRQRDLMVLQEKLHSKAHKLSLSERRDIRHSILSVELELEQARDEKREKDAALREALKHNNQLKKRKLVNHRAERRLMSRVPSFTEDVRTSIEAEVGLATMGGGSSQSIEAIVLDSDSEKFELVLSSLLKENKPQLWKEMNRFESVKKAVFRNIWNEYERKDIVVVSAPDSTKTAKEVQS